MATGPGATLRLGGYVKISSLNTELLHKVYQMKQAGVIMNQKILDRICCIALIGWFLWAVQLFCSAGEEDADVAKSAQAMNRTDAVVVIDAGHGGMDPGKVGVSGVAEKEINLAVAKILKDLLEQNGITVVMTRTEDGGLYHENDGNKKQSDMKERIRILKETAPIVAVSIHQNSFTDSQSRGAQVFYYGDSAEGERGAQMIQETLRTELADGNHRTAKANTSYYMLKRSPCPLVIVECGFLSNPEEERLLQEEEYQRKVAWAVHLGVIQWLTAMEKEGGY